MHLFLVQVSYSACECFFLRLYITCMDFFCNGIFIFETMDCADLDMQVKTKSVRLSSLPTLIIYYATLLFGNEY